LPTGNQAWSEKRKGQLCRPSLVQGLDLEPPLHANQRHRAERPEDHHRPEATTFRYRPRRPFSVTELTCPQCRGLSNGATIRLAQKHPAAASKNTATAGRATTITCSDRKSTDVVVTISVRTDRASARKTSQKHRSRFGHPSMAWHRLMCPLILSQKMPGKPPERRVGSMCSGARLLRYIAASRTIQVRRGYEDPVAPAPIPKPDRPTGYG